MRGTLHTHEDVKAGTITTSAGGEASVAFAKAFLNVNYAISLSCKDPADTAIAMWNNKAVGGFDIKTENDQGNNEGSVVVNWVATPYYDC